MKTDRPFQAISKWLQAQGRRATIVVSAIMIAPILAPSVTASSASGTSLTSAAHVQARTVTFAEPPGVIPSWILPFVDITDYSYFTDFDWDWQMWRPVYFVGTPSSPNVDYSESLAYPPVFSNADRTVSVTLKPWKWSDGTPITARNVLFFYNLLKVEKFNWWLYVPGTFPDDVKSASITGERTITFHLSHSYNPEEFAQNELQSLTPLPLAWDRTSLSGPRGAGSVLPQGTGAGLDMTPAGAKRVYNFLLSQNKNVSAYATNWLWKIVDGPFEVASYAVTGQTSLVPNPRYGGVTPRISRLDFLPFTSPTSEFGALLSGTDNIDVGYTSYSDLNRQSSLSAYTLAPWPTWSTSDLYMNYNNPTDGPIFRQLYIREAMQSLIDQPSIVKYVYKGLAVKSLGMVPVDPATQWLSAYTKSYPFPYNPSLARHLLSSHGWAVHTNGSTTCAAPGTAAGDCGVGIAKGEGLSFQVIYSNGVPEYQTQYIAEKSDFSQAGIVLNLRPVTPSEVFALAPPCTPKQPACSWQMMTFMDNSDYPYPFLAAYWGTGAVENYPSYSSKSLDALFNQAVVAPAPNGLSAPFVSSENVVLSQVLCLWQPVIPYQLSEVRTTLHGVLPQSPELAITPELWYFSS